MSLTEREARYHAVVIVDRHTIVLFESDLTDTERRLELLIDRVPRGVVRFSRHYLPGVAVSHRHVVLWAGTNIYLTPLTGGPIAHFAAGDEVHAAYVVGERWIFVCELSVILFDPHKGAEVARYDHDDVLLWYWWVEDRLVVEDFKGRRLTFKPFEAGTELRAEASA